MVTVRFGPRRRRTKNICKDCEAWKAELGIDEVTNSQRLSKVDETKQKQATTTPAHMKHTTV